MLAAGWTLTCALAAATLSLLYIAALLTSEAARRDAFRLYKRLVFEKTFRDLLPTTRPAWESAALYAETLATMDERRAADLLRRAADASRRRADRMEAVRKVMAEIEKPRPEAVTARRASA